MDKIYLVKDTIDKNDIDKLIDWLKTYPRLTKGPVTLELEEKYSNWLGRKYSVYVNSGSSANLIMLSALQQGKYLKNNKVVVPSVRVDPSAIRAFHGVVKFTVVPGVEGPETILFSLLVRLRSVVAARESAAGLR